MPCQWCDDTGWRASRPYNAYTGESITTWYPCECSVGRAVVAKMEEATRPQSEDTNPTVGVLALGNARKPAVNG